jgi:hypothetical protein
MPVILRNQTDVRMLVKHSATFRHCGVLRLKCVAAFSHFMQRADCSNDSMKNRGCTLGKRDGKVTKVFQSRKNVGSFFLHASFIAL